ncbi:hypothetical protein RVBP14_1850 [Pseudomonas phage sp. Brmt]|nr:hypothetical protein RVBP14_1850 [Pseudomonas phage sp. Brmt]
MGSLTLETGRQIEHHLLNAISIHINASRIDATLRETVNVIDNPVTKRSIAYVVERGKDIHIAVYDTSNDHLGMISHIESGDSEFKVLNMAQAVRITKFSLNQFDEAAICAVSWLAGNP